MAPSRNTIDLESLNEKKSNGESAETLNAVQPFVDSVIKSLVSEYEEKLTSKQEYLDRLVREGQDARELNEALSSQCATLRQYVHQSTIEFQQIREKLLRYEQNGVDELRKVEKAWRERDALKQAELDNAHMAVQRLEEQLQQALTDARHQKEANVQRDSEGELVVGEDQSVIGTQELALLRARWQQWQVSQAEWENKLEAKVELVQGIQSKMSSIESKYNRQLKSKEDELKHWQEQAVSLKMELEDLQKTLKERSSEVEGASSAAVEEFGLKLSELKSAADERQAQLEAKESECLGMAAEWEAKMATVKSMYTKEMDNLRKELEEANAEKIALLEQEWRRSIEELKAQIEDSTSKYIAVRKENDELYNEVQDLKGAIRVYCRVRPLLPASSSDSATATPTSCVHSSPQSREVFLTDPKTGLKQFKFDKIFDHNTTQAGVYEDMQPLVRCVLDGYSVAVLAYGQTGSGKTYTMSGPSRSEDSGLNSSAHRDAESCGVNYRALDDLFHLANERSNEIQYRFEVQMLEIYNDQLRDLLVKEEDGPSGTNKETTPTKLDVRLQLGSGGARKWTVPEARSVVVETAEDVRRTMLMGESLRATGSTSMNERSSRSHSVVTIQVVGSHVHSNTKVCGTLSLVDLAGSERVARSEARGERLKEAQCINRSLSALGDVISAFAAKNNHIPYRNSKLTTLLQDSLGGNSKVCMFVHVSPEVESYGESLSTLYFAQRAASVAFGMSKANVETGVVNTLQEALHKVKEEVEARDREIEHLRSLSKKTQSQQSKMAESKQNQLQSELMEAKKQVKVASEDLQKVASQKNYLEGSVTKLKGDLESTKKEKTHLNDEVLEMKREVARLKAQLRRESAGSTPSTTFTSAKTSASNSTRSSINVSPQKSQNGESTKRPASAKTGARTGVGNTSSRPFSGSYSSPELKEQTKPKRNGFGFGSSLRRSVDPATPSPARWM